MAYCDETDVLRYCSTSESADVEGAIAYATDAVSSYTNDILEPLNDQEVVVTVGRAGIAYLPFTCRTVQTVHETDSGREVAEDAYTFTAGRKAAIRLTRTRPWNILIAGREPWGASNGWDGARLTVECDLGPEATPAAVREAAAIQAARFLVSTGQALEGVTLTAHPQREAGVSSVAVEGYAVTYGDSTAATTGTPSVDRILAPYRRSITRWS